MTASNNLPFDIESLLFITGAFSFYTIDHSLGLLAVCITIAFNGIKFTDYLKNRNKK